MSAVGNDHDREEIRDQLQDLLNFNPPERPPCPQILGIGLTEDICENDTSLKRWLVCQSVEFVVDEGMGVREALAEAFDLAEDQCEHFTLPFPEERQTDFGPLQAEVVREEERERSEQASLPGVEAEGEEAPPELQPQRGGRREQGEQTGLGGRPTREESAEATEQAQRRQRRRERQAGRDRPRTQETLSGDTPARLSEFDNGDRNGNGNGNGNGGDDREGFGPEFSIVPDVLEGDTLTGPRGETWVVTQRVDEANEVSLQNAATDEVRGFTDAQIGQQIRAGNFLLRAREGWFLDRFQPEGARGHIRWERPRTGDDLMLRVRGGDWELRVPDGGVMVESFDLGGGVRQAFEEMERLGAGEADSGNR